MRDEDPVGKSEETREELVKRLREEIRQDEEERKEEQKQKEFEDSQKKVHWTRKRKKPGPKKTEEDEELLESFPNGKVSCASIHGQCILIYFIFSVSCVGNRSGQLDLGSFANTSYVNMPRKKIFFSVSGQNVTM